MDGTVRVRTVVGFSAAMVAAVFATMVLLWTFQADAAPGDSDSTFVQITPCRLIDTRPAPVRVGPHDSFGADETKTIQAHGTNGMCTIPADAVGLSLNVSAVNATALSDVRIWGGGDKPLAASLNPSPAVQVAFNAVNTPLAGDGSFKIFNFQGTVDLIVDVNGYSTKTSLQDLDARIDALEADVVALEDGKVETDANIAALQSAQPVALSDRDNQTTLGVFGDGDGEDPKVIATVTMTPEVAGQITANSVTNVTTNDPISGAPTPFVPTTCSITTGTTIDVDYTQVLTPDNDSNFDTVTGLLSGTRTVDVAAGVPISINLVCQHDSALYTQSILRDSVLTAIFTPSPWPAGSQDSATR